MENEMKKEERIEKISIRLNDTIREALIAIDRGACEIALAVDEEGHLKGTLTDGDIRRVLLGGANLDDCINMHIQRNFTYVSSKAGRNEVLDIMQARSLQQIPVLDSEMRLKGLHLLSEIIGAIQRPNWAIIMVGGQGERLRPLTETIPKPMIRVAGRPILERIILHLNGFGIRKIFLAVNYKSEIIKEYFMDGSRYDCQIEYLEEKKPLGTGGSLALLQGKPEHSLLVLNGDLVTQFDVGCMLSFHENGRYVATVGVKNYMHTVPYGVVVVENKRIIDIREKPTDTWVTNTGIYVLDPSLLTRVPEKTKYSMPSLISECVKRGEQVGAFQISEDWMDIGRPVELRVARGDES